MSTSNNPTNPPVYRSGYALLKHIRVWEHRKKITTNQSKTYLTVVKKLLDLAPHMNNTDLSTLKIDEVIGDFKFAASKVLGKATVSNYAGTLRTVIGMYLEELGTDKPAPDPTPKFSEARGGTEALSAVVTAMHAPILDNGEKVTATTDVVVHDDITGRPRTGTVVGTGWDKRFPLTQRVDYPFPLSNGTMAVLTLPVAMLTPVDATRLQTFIGALTGPETHPDPGPVPTPSTR